MSTAEPRKDHRAAVQAQKLRVDLATKAVRYGDSEPANTPRTVKILAASMAVAFFLLAATIGGAKILQML